MTPGAVPTVVHRSQYDSDFTIIFELFARTGEFVIESGTTARLRGTKTSGTGYSVPIPLNISTKTVTITGDAQMTVAAGNNIFEVVLYLGDLEICSSNFVLAIERAAMDADTITDETVVPELEHLEEYTQQAAEQAARSASTYAESWAVGGTGTREDEDTNNAKYWSEQAQGAVAGVTSFNGRTGAVVPETGDYKSEMIRRGNSTTTVEDTLTSLGNTATDLRSRMYTQEDYTSDLRTRMTTAEGTISSQGTRLGTAESDIGTLKNRATTAESNITTLQNNKVDITTPLLNFDDTATDPLTDDGALANALRTLAILDGIIPTGGGALYLKKALAELSKILDKYNKNYTGTFTLGSGIQGTVHSTTRIIRNGNIVSCYIRVQPITLLKQGYSNFGTITNDDPTHPVIPRLVTYGDIVGTNNIRASINVNANGLVGISSPDIAITNGFIMADLTWAVDPVTGG